MPIQCPKCGKINDGSTYFCIYCGTIFEDYNEKDNVISKKIVFNLNNNNNNENKFSQEDNNINNIDFSKIQNKRKHRIAIYLGYLFSILGGLLGFIIAIYLITRKDPVAKKHGLIQIGILLLWALILAVMISTGALDYHTLLDPSINNMTNTTLGNISYGFFK